MHMKRIFCLIITVSIFFSQFIFAQDFNALSGGTVKTVEVKIATFLGNGQRNYYGNNAPSALKMHWKTYLGKGKTVISKKVGEKEWAGSGWTGQPLLVLEDGYPYLIQGAYDHHLKKIDARTGRIKWQYAYDDVIKGTGTLWLNKYARTLDESLVVLQGSRLGYGVEFYSRIISSFRAVSYFTGKELWRMNVKATASYSRDVDGSALVLNDTVYIGLENGTLVILNPDPARGAAIDKMYQPRILNEIKLFDRKDIIHHGGNLVIESSPAAFNNHVYITSGSGHVFGYNLKTRVVDWDFYIGSDLDGSPVVTGDSCLLITVEKQYIAGPGGVLKLNPKQDPTQSVVWFFPTGDDSLLDWAGGIIGSTGINDQTKLATDPGLCSFIGIDGYLYVVNHQEVDRDKGNVVGPDGKTEYMQPKLIFKKQIMPSISTPVFVNRKLVAAGYGGLYLFEYDSDLNFNLLAKRLSSAFESTPIVYDRMIYLGSRDGYLYCLGD